MNNPLYRACNNINHVIDPEKDDEILGISTQSVIKVTKASITQGLNVFHNFVIITDDKVSDEVTLDEKLIFLKKSWYLTCLAKKGMMDKQGSINLHHPHFQITPLSLMTRLKKAKLGTVGILCLSLRARRPCISK